MTFTEEQIFGLAPDEPSKKAGKDLANPSKWVSKGINEQALWGECQGSGSKPYQTQIDIANLAFKCSCPSRKFPCKHGLGLLLLQCRQPALFTDTEAPAWVTEWISKRVQKEETKATKKEAPVDEAAQAKRVAARTKTVEGGLEELLLWVKDIIRNGILTMPEKSPSFFTDIAKRMVDAKAPGLAGAVKALGSTAFYKEGWQSSFADGLVRIYLLIISFKRLPQLPALLQEDIKAWIGFTQSQDELKEQNGITDTWLVLSRQTSEEESLTIEKLWLYGTTSQKYALVLQFGFRGQGITLSLSGGMSIQAEIIFFPSVQPLRAIIKRHISAKEIGEVKGYDNWQQVAEAETQIAEALPFSSERPYIVEGIKPVQHAGGWWLADSRNQLMQITDHYKGIYTLLALTGGRPAPIVVLGKEAVYEPVGIWSETGYISFNN